MIINQITIELLKRFEGCKLTAYKDSGGVWTIGYGTTAAAGVGIDPHEGMTITQDQAEVLLHKTIDGFAKKVSSLITINVTSNEFAACLLLSYNIGIDAFAKSTLLKHLNAGKKDLAAAEFKKWNHDNGKVVKGLTKRRAAEAELFLTPDAIVSDMHTIAPQEKSSRESAESTLSAIFHAISALLKGVKR
jgi:lysozyme